MMRFEHPEYLYLLLSLPLLSILFYLTLRARKAALERLADSQLLNRLMPEKSKYKITLKFFLSLGAILFLCLAAANFQMGTETRKVKRKSTDIFIALDISKSMLAKDVVPNRMERAKKFARELVRELSGERLGLIIFAGNAYLQVPLTTDYAGMDLMIRTANPDLAPTQGTAIVDAIDLAEKSFPEENKNHKALIVISDGENHDDEAISRMKSAQSEGLVAFSVGVGTDKGSFIPVVINGRSDYKRDVDGSPVRTTLNEDMLKELAEAGGGAYFNLSNTSEELLSVLKGKVNSLEKRELEQRIFDEYNSYFQYFLAFGILLLIIEFVIHFRKNEYFAQKDLFKE